MSEDFLDKNESPNNHDGSDRDGSYPKNDRPYGTGRPRFNRNFHSDNRGAYTPHNHYDNNRQDGYRPRYNSQARENGYQPRPRFNDEGGYQPRPRFNNERNDYGNGGYQRNNGFRPRQDGWHSENRFNKRPGYEGNRYYDGDAGRPYRPKFRNEEEGFQPRYGNASRPRTGYSGRPQQRRYGNYDSNAKYSQKKRLEYKEKNYDPTVPVRLNKFLANAGICSRRDADNYIAAGVVTVNGVVVTELGSKVLRTDTVLFHDTPVKMEKKVYVLLNKPKGYITTSEDPQDRKTVMELVKNACPERIYPVGRLDRSTTGVLLLTNDGELASKLTHPKFLKKKIYHVHTDKNVTAADMRQIAEGITLEDGEIKVDAIEYADETDKKQVGVEIHSGKNRIVRRIFEHFGYRVVKLDRVYFAGLTKKNVKRGDWRYLTEKEVNMLQMGAFE